MESHQRKFKVLKGLSVLFVLMAVITVIPGKGVQAPSMLGYRSLCPFAPVSTGIALYVAYMIRRYLDRISKQQQK